MRLLVYTKAIKHTIIFMITVQKRPKIKRWRLRIDSSAAVTLTVPLRTSQSTIESILRKHGSWIAQHIARRQADEEKAAEIYADHAPLIPLLGDWIEPPKELHSFYRREARSYFLAECAAIAAKIGVSFAKVRIGDPRSRYGSCSSKGTLSFSFRVIKAPRFVAHYIAAHECSHLKFMHHRAEFWECVRLIAPEYKAAEAWLKQNGNFLRFDQCTRSI
ncbi:zinc metalloprotease [Campylobacterota bacterium]|nr:zinc metalloprotease [Campylobacterota bacterium]